MSYYIKVGLKLLLQVPCCRFSTVYIFTDNTLNHIQEKAIDILNDKMRDDLKPKRNRRWFRYKHV